MTLTGIHSFVSLGFGKVVSAGCPLSGCKLSRSNAGTSSVVTDLLYSHMHHTLYFEYNAASFGLVTFCALCCWCSLSEFQVRVLVAYLTALLDHQGCSHQHVVCKHPAGDA